MGRIKYDEAIATERLVPLRDRIASEIPKQQRVI